MSLRLSLVAACAIVATSLSVTSMELSPTFSVVLPSPGDGSGGANLTYNVYASFGTTGRVAVLGNPKGYFNVFCAGCDTAHRCLGVLETVETQAQIHGCRYATNGGPFALGDCLSPIISNGTIMSTVPQGSFQCVGMFHNGSWILGYVDPSLFPMVRNLMCGFTWLVVDDEAMTFKDIEIAPRTVFGIDEQGALVTLVAEGSEVAFTGLTLNQTAQWAKQLGARYAINMDGGGSSTSYWADNGGVQGCPTCVDQPFCCSRAVSTIMCVPPDA